MNILFVCSKNKWRSRTAETIFSQSQNHNVFSAGTDSDARIKLNEKLLQKADIVFVMEKKHRDIIREKFPEISPEMKIIILDIPDEYQYMDEELIEILKTSVSGYISDIL